MFKRFLWITLSAFALVLVFLINSTSTAQCAGVCSGTHSWNFDLSMRKTYIIEPGCSGSAKVVTFTLNFMNSGLQTATGLLIADISSTSGGLTMIRSGGNVMIINLTGLLAGESRTITYQALLYGSGYFSNNASISELAGNEPTAYLFNNNSQATGLINASAICTSQWGLWGGSTYMPVPLPTPYVAATVPVQIITYIPKTRVIGNNASTYYGFTRIIDNTEKSTEIAMIKENTKWGKLPFVWAEKSRIIWKWVLMYVPGMSK